MQHPDKISSRKKFLLWGAAVFSSLTAFKFMTGSKMPARSQGGKKTETVKMLTQDGKLVEVDAEKLFCGKRKKNDLPIFDKRQNYWQE